MTGVLIPRLRDCDSTNFRVEYIHDISFGFKSIIGNNETVDWPGYSPEVALLMYPDQLGRGLG